MCSIAFWYVYNVHMNYWHDYFSDLPLYIAIYRVTDNRRNVNTLKSAHISDKLGAENVC